MVDEKNVDAQGDELDDDESEDEDYVPSNDEGSSDREPYVQRHFAPLYLGDDDELDLKNVVESDDSDQDQGKRKRRKIEDDGCQVKVEPKLTAEEEKAKSDALWAELNSDVKQVVEKSSVAITATTSSIITIANATKSVPSTSSPSLLELKTVPMRGGLSGLAALRQASAQKKAPAAGRLSAILGKKTQPSTLTKTKEDWEKFKNDSGLAEELREHTKSKDSFVERQAFLQRSDLKQFEQEKAVRDRIRARQMNQK